MVQVNVETGRLRTVLDGRWGSVREGVRAQIRGAELLRPVQGLSVEAHRDRVMEQARLVSQTRSARLFFPRAYGGEGDMGGALAAFETVALVELSLLVKIGVQFGLFGGVIRRLGTERHHQRYLRDAMTMELPGCFAMTETRHGSDVQSIRTIATYDPEHEEFVIHTPDDDARKDYIGNVARDGRMAAVFAQLMTAGKGRGVHVFLVPIRDQRGRPCRGVRIEDCGHKGGLNGVDNGRLWFDQVRVPREALLDRFGKVARVGSYSSPIESETRRFFTMLGTLVSGRVSVAGAALSATKLAMTIAVRYGLTRRQFRAPGTDREVILLDYLQHQRRLLPALATTYAMHFAQEALVTSLHDAGDGDSADEAQQRQLETLAAGVKALTTWHATHTIQTCREACGGAGYLTENRLADLKADTDVFTTFEGDNTVLLQLVAKGLLTDYKERFGDLSQLEMVRFVGAQVFDTVVERSLARQLVGAVLGAVPSNEEEPAIEERDFQLHLFRGREEHVLGGVTRRLKRGLDDGQDSFTVFNECQDHVLEAARGHVDRLILEAFEAAVNRCEEGPLRDTLASLCDLYALS